MVKRSRGSLSGTTRKTKKKRKVTVSKIVRKFEVGDKILLTPSHVVKGRLPRKYNGKHGKIVEKRGNSYVIEVADGGKRKRFITDSVHLAPSR